MPYIDPFNPAPYTTSLNPAQIKAPPMQSAATLPKLTSTQFNQVAKYAKWAISATQYEDSKTVEENLLKALALIQTGRE